MRRITCWCLVVTVLLLVNHAEAWKHFWRGKWFKRNVELSSSNTNLPPDQWFDQKLDHFDVVNLNTWKQVIRNASLDKILSIKK
jgi:hypothetical protein